ncbi:MAG: DUF429 domain-containing protein [Candidatus Omnitrophica bacterium]|nr:DUF429 domain-containing protein [Candidatus Omnitrophota bacterium]MCF7892408.1 DUF429 domain-containing protein [Candidatus Omnitrophota bacterium]MCF7897744.1 DUF429 domain-containing protein [Candidatus Omnitrophota bacterium]MCF7909792.1 DUF429 domain-containing protein [Candidatus Omnitrophota bacterium]
MKYVGIDGCKKGWFAVTVEGSDQSYEVKVFENIKKLWEHYKNDSLKIAIDIPIGLPDKKNKVRQCDIKARKELGKPRGAGVFPPPSEKVLNAETYEEACVINKRELGKKISKQTWSILPKIKEVDSLLSKDKKTGRNIIEIHPEVCFWSLNNKNAMKHNKKKKEGYEERLKLLKCKYHFTDKLPNYALNNFKRKEVAKDDILDALVAAYTAEQAANGNAIAFGGPDEGQIWFPNS